MNRNGYGRCQKSNPRQANGLPFCYVNEPSSCSDLQTSKTDRSKKFSAVAFGGGVVIPAVEGYFPEVVAVLKVVVGGSTEKWRNQICVINPI